MTETPKQKLNIERIKVEGKQLVDKIREILEEGNARRVILKKDKRTLMEFPLAVGVGGAAAAILFAPVLAAVGALAALVSDIEVLIEREIIDPAALDEHQDSVSEGEKTDG